MRSEYINGLAGNNKQTSSVTAHIDFWWLKNISSYNSNATKGPK